MSRFTIGIPTYNRADFLPRAIECALPQTWPDVEVIISDNASTDETPEIVRSYGDRVRYHRNDTNVGAEGNFSVLTELATGEYFSWLQDDDVIHIDFAKRAAESLSASDDRVVYIAWVVYAASPMSIPIWSPIVGPIVPVDWMAGIRKERSTVCSLQPHFVSLESQGQSPAVAMRTDVVRRSVKETSEDCLYFGEHIVLAVAAAHGRVVIDPWIAAIISLHDNKVSAAHYKSKLRRGLQAEACSRGVLPAIYVESPRPVARWI